MYYLYITRKYKYLDQDGPTISEEEFNGVRADFVHGVDYNDEPGGYFVWYDAEDGDIRISVHFSDEHIEEMAKVAQKLSANLAGENFELYADFAETHSPTKPDFRKLMGANLPEGFPLIDNLNRDTRTVAKMEVLDLKDPVYKDLNILYGDVKNYVVKMGTLENLYWSGYTIRKGREYTNREMILGIPAGTATPAQKDKLIELQQYARKWDVRLIIMELPSSFYGK